MHLMSTLRRKLHPPNKALKRFFTKTLKPKLQNHSISRTVKKATRYLKSLRLSRRHRNHHHRRLHHYRLETNLGAIYTDELFEGAAFYKQGQKIGSTSSSNITDNVSSESAKVEASKGLPRNCHYSTRFKFQGVDEKANEFISKFRHEMELQREQSLIDFQEMLARSV